MKRFENEPVLELRRPAVRAGLGDALVALDARGPVRVPVWIGDERREGDALASTDPGRPDRVVALAAAARPDETEAALETASRAARDWAARPAAERAAVLVRAAAWMRERRVELAALEVRECAKPWGEADADVCEAIDFLEYYARGAVDLEERPALLGAGAAGSALEDLIQPPGERNTLRWAARGVVAVISPWNFPIAIPCGMTAAGLAVGNAVVLKPAEQAPGCAFAIARALHEGGLPPGVLSLLPGEGEVGAALVKDRRVHVIAFTGSSPVGLEILRTAAELAPGQKHLKRVVAEMGGKNCVIVDSDADLDEVVPGLVRSAFTYAGQKCSAAARVLCHEAVHDALVQRLAGAVEVLEVGQASDLAIDVPPVIEQEAAERVARYAALAEREGRIAARARSVPGSGWFATPSLATDLPADSSVLGEEIFGPLLAVERVRDIDEACDRVDASPFALTGGLFCRNPDTVDRVVARSPVGNLYVNRYITGAMVARQPFGGNRLSGTGTKAGGPGYLLHFVEPRVVTENTMRHGLVV
ncbi:MAG: RHH-type transcriptional regulator, proline utilization regulon repressor / proline dehydrogenase [Solirubrobacteraceae bacterium]|nr:RHH-type transcriptional regulator, proline utilization regulon repressor / proline dehydrogenase [Solirubrobacteraceae bacterium]